MATDHYTDSASYWEHEQNICCDMVRQMEWKCDYGKDSSDPADRRIYAFCNEEGKTDRMAFPNFFITIAPAEWLFPLPVWMKDVT